jgi:autotransporter passenger strand-loop-strand repeat protein/uncharacterized repeat protein (TIGR03803 family)
MPTLITVVSFDGADGQDPQGGVIADAAGNLLGTTYLAGPNGEGTVFAVLKTAGGYASTPTTLLSGNGTFGPKPAAGLIADASGHFFGTTSLGGANSDGTVFEFTEHTSPSLSLDATLLVQFNQPIFSTEGVTPDSGLTLDAAGDLFGTTEQGGANGVGTVFEIPVIAGSYASTPTTLVSFDGADGANPQAGLIMDAAGDLFGTTPQGVFEIPKAGGLITLASFTATNGPGAAAGLVADAAGNLFGTTYAGGANSFGSVFEIAKTGSGYADMPTTLVSFDGADGATPQAGLIVDAAGDLFGTTTGGGFYSEGTVFEIANTGGSYASTPTTLVSFNVANGDGAYPTGTLFADAAGDLFGTTEQGGANGEGTVFEVTGTGYDVGQPTVVSSGQSLNISAGQTGNGVVVLNGGRLNVLSGGIASGTVVNTGGLEIVESGGTASGSTVSSGGVVDVLDGGMLAGAVANDGTVNYDITGSATFGGSLTGAGTLVVSGGGALDVASAYSGAAQIDDGSTLEFTNTNVGVATFSSPPTGPGGTLKLDAPSTGPITVVNPNDTVIAQPGSNNWINAAVSYTLPANIDALFLYAGAQGTGNSDAQGDALYGLDTGNAQTLTGNSLNDTFVVYNSSDVVAPKPGSHDVVYAAASYTLPTGVDVLILEGTATQGVGNSDAAGDGLYAANAAQVATLTGNSANDTFVVYNSADVVVPKAGSHDVVYSAVNYTLPTGVDVLILEGTASQGVGNSDASGDALYAANPNQVATLVGNSANDTFVVYNSADVVVPKAGSHDVVYSAVNYALPTGVDSLILEAGTQAIGNTDASGDTLYAANAGIAQTMTGHSHNDTFVVYNSGDVVVGQAGSTDTVYAAASFTLPTNVDTLFLEGTASHGTGNNDAVDTLFGNAGIANTLVAGSGADLLVVAGTAGTIFTGGAGHDTFAFPNAMGHDEVTNFGIAKDTLQFNATLFSNFTAAMNQASQSGANTVFTIDADDTVTLDNVTKSSLTAANFHFT